jgi:quercetin dioxygenase-like cupin family protein
MEAIEMDAVKTLRGPAHDGGRTAILISADAGAAETVEGFATFRTKISRYEDEEASFSVVDIDVAPGQQIPLHTNEANERVAICYAGEGRVHANGEEHAIAQGGMMYWGRGAYIGLTQTGSEPLRLSVVSLDTEAAAAASLFPIDQSALVVAGDPDALAGASGAFLVEQEEEGEQYWQAAPSLGFITLKFGDDLPVDYFSASSQTLDADAAVRLHGHRRSTEIVVCTRGRGLAIVGEVEQNFSEGDLLILPPGVTHRFVNDSGQPWTYSGLFTPPSVESALRETGVRKMPGTERPTAIPRNPTTERLLVEKYGFIIPSLQ